MDFAYPELRLTALGAATTIPAFAQLDSAGRSALVEKVSLEIEDVTRSYHDGGKMTFPMSTHIGFAYTE